MARIAVIVVAVICAPIVLAQQPAPAFEVVSIKRSPPDAPLGRAGLQPGGRYVMTNGPVRILINVAYPSSSNEIINAPAWVTYENYDVVATATQTATADDISAMMRAMLAERSKLAARYENRQRPRVV